jgi:hypothetical protein
MRIAGETWGNTSTSLRNESGDARTFVVNTHDQLRARLKELEEQKTIQTE